MERLQYHIHIRDEQRKSVDFEELYLIWMFWVIIDLDYLCKLIVVSEVLLLFVLPLILLPSPLLLLPLLLSGLTFTRLRVFDEVPVPLKGAHDVPLEDLVDVHFLGGVHLLKVLFSSLQLFLQIFLLLGIFLVDEHVDIL